MAHARARLLAIPDVTSASGRRSGEGALRIGKKNGWNEPLQPWGDPRGRCSVSLGGPVGWGTIWRGQKGSSRPELASPPFRGHPTAITTTPISPSCGWGLWGLFWLLPAQRPLKALDYSAHHPKVMPPSPCVEISPNLLPVEWQDP